MRRVRTAAEAAYERLRKRKEAETFRAKRAVKEKGRPARFSGALKKDGKRMRFKILPGRAGSVISAIVALPILTALLLVFLMCGAGAMAASPDPGLKSLDTEALETVKTNVTESWNTELRDMRKAADESGKYLSVSVQYNESDTGDTDGSRISNWDDVLAVWLAENGRELTAGDEESVRDIYFLLNPMELKEYTEILPGGTEGKRAVISVRNLRYPEADTGMTEEQERRAESFLKGGSAYMLRLLCGEETGTLTYPAYLPASGGARAALMTAASREGCPYSNSLRMREGYDDCSSLVWKCCMAAGVDLGDPDYAPTAASIAKWCHDKGCIVDEKDILPGDLVFWADSKRNNGRFKDVYHTALYAGGGMIWEAAPSAGGVVCREISRQRPRNILCYARPYGV